MLGEATLNGSVTSFREAIRPLILFAARHNDIAALGRAMVAGAWAAAAPATPSIPDVSGGT